MSEKTQLKALRLAVCKGSAPKVAQHLKGLSLANEPAGEAPSLLAEALSRGHLAIAATLLEQGARAATGEGAALLVMAFKAEKGVSLIEPIIAALGGEAAAQVGAYVPSGVNTHLVSIYTVTRAPPRRAAAAAARRARTCTGGSSTRSRR